MADVKPKIAIVTDEPGWHGRQLKEALAAHGLSSQYISSMECLINITDSGTQINLPGFESVPLAVFVRGVPGGTLEQVIFRLNILHTLSEMGIVVYNNPRGIERTVDKAMTSFLLKQAGLPTPETWVCESNEKAEFIYRQECGQGKKLVIKPLFGSQGIGVHLLDSDTGLIHDENFAGVYYLQSFIDCGDKDSFDIRVFVINGKAIAAMTRRSKSWITNRAQGAQCEPLKLDGELHQLSEAAVKAVGIDYGGVDLIPDTNGRLQVIEVNSIPAWWGLQKVTDFNIASSLIDDMVNRLSHSDSLTVLP
ncbi:MAG: RimK family alpha-L-glutamate ligase [Gammaproteobacteria bacterium]